MSDSYISSHINMLKQKYSDLRPYQDYHVFSILCMKYFFHNEAGVPFDIKDAVNYLTDGANDGGIDAIFNDPQSSDNDVIVMQSKYYNKTDLSAGDIVSELLKINSTLKNLQNNKISTFNDKLVTQYRHVTSQKEDDGNVRVFFFTTYEPKNRRERNSIEKKINDILKDTKFDFEICYASDINAQIEYCETGSATVDNGKLILDQKDNYLSYEESVVVNISALSLQNIYIAHRNSLLGMNLRYYVRNKNVDDGIVNTIKKEPSNFWYKNNGIVIICDDFTIDGREIKLTNFSIINGGQTTNRIGHVDIEEKKDFYIQCKIVKSKGKDDKEKTAFANKIAESTNSQKPIKKTDLIANTYEQLQLKARLNDYMVYYITKKGDKTPKQYSEPYQAATIESVGKLSLATVLQMPGSSRSNSKKMYNDDIYHVIFGSDARAGVIADSLKISYYYDQYVKTELKDKGYSTDYDIPTFKNGKSFMLASICFLSKIIQGVFSFEAIEKLLNNPESLKELLRQNGEIKNLIVNKLDDEKEIIYSVFNHICVDVLSDSVQMVIEKAKDEGNTLSVSDFLKVDNNYYKFILRPLWRRYNQNKELNKAINKLSSSNN